MSKIEVKKIVRKFAKKLKEEKYPFSAVYLFGSFAKGKAHKWSDIDVAVVSPEVRKNRFKAGSRLWTIGTEVDSRIEPYGFTPEGFADYWNPMAHEVKKTGIRVA